MRPIHRVATLVALPLTLLAACDFDPNRLRAKPDATAGAPDLAPPVDTASPDRGTGGTIATGGIAATGGTIGTGGALATGGSLRTGGVLNTGGVAMTGGIASTGGLPRTGGITITGGTIPATGGQLVITGGSTTTGGVLVATGGATVATGGEVTPPSGNTVSFLNGKALGALMGYAWIAVPAAPTISDPTCGPNKTAITSAGCPTFVNWSATDKVCISGFLPALPVDAVTADYDINWGVSLGLNVTEAGDSGLGQSFTSIAITLTGSPTNILRAMVHKKGEANTISYCSALTSGVPIPFTNFVTDCYNTVPTGTRITAADVPNLDQVLVQVPSKTTAITITNLCVTGITFTK